MNCKIELDNSYCSLETDSFKEAIKIINEVCSMTQVYFGLDYYTKKPIRKTKILSFFELKNKIIIFPRGWFWEIYDKLKLNDFKIRLIDKRAKLILKPIELKNITLFNYQKEAVQAALDYRYGIMSHLTGSGKSFVALGIIAKVGTPGLIIVPSIMLMYQFKSHLNKYFPDLSIGLIGDGEFSIGDITIGITKSLFLKRKKLQEFYQGPLQFLILDESHGIREGQFNLKNEYFYIALEVNAHFKIGLTATPGDPGTIKRRLLEGVTGGIIHSIDAKTGREYGIVVDMKVFMLKTPLMIYRDFKYHEALDKNLLDNRFLYQYILDIVNETKKRNLTLLIICDRVAKQLKVLEELLPEAVMLYGQTPSGDRERIKQDVEDNKIKVLVSTVIKEGISIKNIDVIILASGGKDSDSLIQKFGRGLRAKKGKSHLVFIDFKFDKVRERTKLSKSINGILYNHSLNRKRTYKKLNYEVTEVMNASEVEWEIKK